MNLRLYLNIAAASSLTFTLCLSKLVLLNSQLLPSNATSMAFTFAATVQNDGTDEDAAKIPARLEAISCCQEAPSVQAEQLQRKNHSTSSDQDCESLYAHSGLAQRVRAKLTKVLQAFLLNKHLRNRRGNCTFRIHGSHDIKSFNISFDTRSTRSAAQLQGKTDEVPRCALLDQNPLDECAPVNCVQKYVGYRSIYNSSTGNCQPTSKCTVDDAVAANISAMEREERRPMLVLDMAENKCKVRKTTKSIKTRSVLDKDEEKASVGAFTVAYGITLAKLLIAMALTVIFLFVVCVVCNFFFGFCATWGMWTSRKSCPNTKHEPPPGDKSGVKYSRIISEDEQNPESASKVIREVKDRREMQSRPYQAPNSRESYGSAEQSRRPSNIEMEGGEQRSSSYKPTQSLSKEVGTSYTQIFKSSAGDGNRTGVQMNVSSNSGRKLPRVDKLLDQFHFGRKKSKDYNHHEHLRSELSRAFGGFGHDQRHPLPRTTQLQSVPRPFPRVNSHVVNVGSTPVIHSSVHKIQEDGSRARTMHTSDRQGYQSQQRELSGTSSGGRARPGGQNTSRRSVVPSDTGSELVNHIESETMPSNVNFSHWANIPSDDSVHRLYKTEMAKAASFLRELDHRGKTSEPESPVGLIRVLQKRDTGTVMLPEEITMSSLAVQTTARMKEDSSQTVQTIRRIKEEPPIPLSMIRTNAKPDEEQQSTGNGAQKIQIYAQQNHPSVSTPWANFGASFTAPASPAQIKTPTSRPGTPLSAPVEFVSRQAPSSLTPRPEKPMININKGEMSPAGGGESLEASKNPNSGSSFAKSPAARSLYESALELHQNVVNSKFINMDSILGQSEMNNNKEGSVNAVGIMEQSIPPELIHSPPFLSTSTSSCELSESESKYKSSPRNLCFFDNDLVPARTASRSEEILHSRRWIDNFKTREKPQ